MTTQNQLQPQKKSFDELTPQQAFNSPAVLERFASVLKGSETQFVASLLSIVNSNRQLQMATNSSIMTAAMKAATLKLPIEPSLGLAYVVAYNRNEKQGNKWVKIPEAQFQIGYRGLIQLAQRSGQIKNINCDIVYASEFIKYDKVYGDLILSDEQVDSGEVKGYFASIELINGFRKMIFWTKEKVLEHAKKYSKTYDAKEGAFRKNAPWATEFDAMALKTLLKELLSKYAPLSVEMQDAITADNADSTVNERETKDITPEEPTQDGLAGILPTPPAPTAVDQETGEILEEPTAAKTETVDTSYPAEDISAPGDEPVEEQTELFKDLAEVTK